MADRKVGAVLKSIVFLFFSCVYSSIFTNRVSLHILRLKNESTFLFLLGKESDGALQAPPVLSGMKPRRPGDLARFIQVHTNHKAATGVDYMKRPDERSWKGQGGRAGF